MWTITKDKIDNGLSVGRESYDFDKVKWEAAEKTKFRLLDDDNEIYFYGEYDGVNESAELAFAPLDEWGESFGCTELQYKNKDGEWETL